MPGYASATASHAPIRQRSEPIDRIAAGAPIRQLLLVEALGRARVPAAGRRPDHRTRQGQWVASVLRDNPGYPLGAVATATANAPIKSP
jgi:hypothetical protein